MYLGIQGSSPSDDNWEYYIISYDVIILLTDLSCRFFNRLTAVWRVRDQIKCINTWAVLLRSSITVLCNMFAISSLASKYEILIGLCALLVENLTRIDVRLQFDVFTVIKWKNYRILAKMKNTWIQGDDQIVFLFNFK